MANPPFHGPHHGSDPNSLWGRDPFDPTHNPAPGSPPSPFGAETEDWAVFPAPSPNPTPTTEAASEFEHKPRVLAAAREVGSRIVGRLFKRRRGGDTLHSDEFTGGYSPYDYPGPSSLPQDLDGWGGQQSPSGSWFEETQISPPPKPPLADSPRFSKRTKLIAGLAAIGVVAGIGGVAYKVSKGENERASTGISAEEKPGISGTERIIINPKTLRTYEKAFKKSECGGQDQDELAYRAAESYTDMFGDTLPTTDPESMAALAAQAASELKQAESALSWHTLTQDQLTAYNRLKDDIVNNEKPTIPFGEYKILINEFLKEFKIKAVFDWDQKNTHNQEEIPRKSDITPMTENQLESSVNARAVVLGIIDAYTKTPVEQSKKLGIKKLYLGQMTPPYILGGVYTEYSSFFGFISTQPANYVLINAGNTYNNTEDPINQIEQANKTILHETQGHVYGAGSKGPLCMLWEIPGYQKAAFPMLNPKDFEYGRGLPDPIEGATSTQEIEAAATTTDYGNTNSNEDFAELVSAALGDNPSEDLFGKSSAKPKIIYRKLGLWASSLSGKVRDWVESRIRLARIEAAMHEKASNPTDGS